ncbi:MAG: deoxyribose-phosphate aldolase [Paludibacteraceae bacterium]|nr:deoxyribose-phosphate aldolase [Paludibacteraceae bacterium]
MKEFESLFEQYHCDVDDKIVENEVKKIIIEHYEENNNVEVYKKCLNLIDLTTLNVDDTAEKVENMVEKVNNFSKNFSDIPNVAAICVYPALVKTVKENLRLDIGIAAVSAGFPASQTFIEVKIAETALSVHSGASEIDVVISVGKFLEKNYNEVFDELEEIKAACGEAHLKVILETGALKTAENIKKASVLAMELGADFIKTSTGKINISATLEATYVMCNAIKEWYEKTGVMVGYKPAGGISTTEEAVKHYTLVKHILGDKWLNNNMFRFGASRLANNLLSSITGKEVIYF